MASDTVRAALNKIWPPLEALGHRCALMGGAALAVWNYPRATRDVDVLLGIDSASFPSVMEHLTSAGFRPKKSPPLANIGGHSLAQFLYTPPDEFYDVQFDIWLAESALQRFALDRSLLRQLPGVDKPIRVLSVEDLILFKLVAGRMIDRADAAMLLRENRDSIDFQYLRDWVTKLNLSSELATIWTEAFPGEAAP